MKVLEKYAGIKRGNYCDLPSIDVDILPDVYLCADCDEEVVYDAKGGYYALGKWVHVNSDAAEHGYVSNRTRCRYCHSQKAVYRQHAWYDAVECDRCGAVEGHAIGD